jgi:hypothetical protein
MVEKGGRPVLALAHHALDDGHREQHKEEESAHRPPRLPVWRCNGSASVALAGADDAQRSARRSEQAHATGANGGMCGTRRLRQTMGG